MKALEALKRIKPYADSSIDGELDIIEKELKQAEENEKLLKVFKSALTIEHHEYPTIEQHNDSEDVMSYLVKELYTIRQSELEKDMRKALREWVLKNAFPKELKALEIIKNTGVLSISETIGGNHYIETMADTIGITKENYDLIKEVLL